MGRVGGTSWGEVAGTKGGTEPSSSWQSPWVKRVRKSGNERLEGADLGEGVVHVPCEDSYFDELWKGFGRHRRGNGRRLGWLRGRRRWMRWEKGLKTG